MVFRQLQFVGDKIIVEGIELFGSGQGELKAQNDNPKGYQDQAIQAGVQGNENPGERDSLKPENLQNEFDNGQEADEESQGIPLAPETALV
mmetsp:Transcript_24037/g.51109  ORF Transcript_24037/g.51109 Transcript_24037/m.51109 type:complete len:91 (-) Transcript_24037:773-1045(-)